MSYSLLFVLFTCLLETGTAEAGTTTSGGGESGRGAAGTPGEQNDSRGADSTVSDSIGSLFHESPENTGDKRDDKKADSQGVLFRMLGWVAALAILAVAVVRIWKKVSSPGRTGLEGGGLRVVGRTALTPRHFVYAVRVGTQRLLVVGVSGDRISALTEFDDPAQVLSLDTSFQKELDKAGLKESAPDGNDTASFTEGLSPCRQEVRRLVEVVRNWRGRMAQTFGPPMESRSGK